MEKIFIYLMSGLKENKDLQIDESNEKDDNIPILLLSKDLINQINSVNENQTQEKDETKNEKDINYINFHSDESTNDEESQSKKQEKEDNQEILFNFDFFQNEKEEKEIDKDNIKNENNLPETFGKKEDDTKLISLQTSTNNNFYNQPNIQNFQNQNLSQLQSEKNDIIFNPQEKQFCLNSNNNSNNNFNNNFFNNNCFNNNFNNINNNFNNNNFNNPVNFMNSCFSMNGKQGWICSECKNFNYESKLIIIIIYFFLNFSKI